VSLGALADQGGFLANPSLPDDILQVEMGRVSVRLLVPEHYQWSVCGRVIHEHSTFRIHIYMHGSPHSTAPRAPAAPTGSLTLSTALPCPALVVTLTLTLTTLRRLTGSDAREYQAGRALRHLPQEGVIWVILVSHLGMTYSQRLCVCDSVSRVCADCGVLQKPSEESECGGGDPPRLSQVEPGIGLGLEYVSVL